MSWGKANLPGAHASLSRQIVWAGSGDEEKQDGGAIIPAIGFEAEAQEQSLLGISLASLCMPTVVRGNKEHYADIPLLENAACSRSCSVLNNDHINSNILHRLLGISQGHLSTIPVGSVGYLACPPSQPVKSDPQQTEEWCHPYLLFCPLLWRGKPAAGSAQHRVQ